MEPKVNAQNIEVEELMQSEIVFMSSSRIRRSSVNRSQVTGNLQSTSVRSAETERIGTAESLQEVIRDAKSAWWNSKTAFGTQFP